MRLENPRTKLTQDRIDGYSTLLTKNEQGILRGFEKCFPGSSIEWMSAPAPKCTRKASITVHTKEQSGSAPSTQLPLFLIGEEI